MKQILFSLSAVAVTGLFIGCATEIDDSRTVYQEVVGECTTTNQCKNMYGGATDCKNSEGGVCYCGAVPCSATGGDGDGGDGDGTVPSGAIRLENKGHGQWLQGTADADATATNNGVCGDDAATNVRANGTGNTGDWTRWILEPTTGSYFHVRNVVSGKYLQATNLADASGNFSAVRLVETSCSGAWTQWEKVSTGDGYFHLKNRQHGTFLQNTNLSDADTGDGLQVRVVSPNKTGDWTRWREIPAGTTGGDGDGDGGSSGGWRVGYSADGNQHDWDDHHASPMSLALLHRAGLKSKLVHFDYNNHLGDNNGSMASGHRNNVNWAVNQLGFDSSVFFDDQNDVSGAVSSIANAINASSSSDRFFLICAGPMEVCWRGINAAQDSKEQFVTVISHSTWNDNHQDTGQMTHDWNDIKSDFDVVAHHINDQNSPAFKSGCGSWEWLENISGYGSGLYNRMCDNPTNRAGDASDAGMTYYLIQADGNVSGSTGTSNPSMNDVRSFFGQ